MKILKLLTFKTETHSIDSYILKSFQIVDRDLGDAATCSIDRNFTTNGQNIDNLLTPFSMKGTEIVLEFDVLSSMTGRFTMSVTCSDRGIIPFNV